MLIYVRQLGMSCIELTKVVAMVLNTNIMYNYVLLLSSYNGEINHTIIRISKVVCFDLLSV